MRVLALVTEAYGGRGGIARYNRDWLSALANTPDIQLQVLPRFGSTHDEPLPAGIVQHAAHASALAYSIAALRLTLKKRPQLILCGHLYMAPLAALLAKLLGVPFWLQLHGIEAWPKPPPLRQRAAERAMLVTAVSRYTRSRFLDWAAIQPEQVRVLPNTIDTRYRPGSPSTLLRETYGLTGKKVLLTVGRLSPQERYKGQDRVITLLPALLQQVPDAIYLMVGEGEDRVRLEKIAADLGVITSVRFTGHFPEIQMPELYRSADVFVMPSTGEGFGIAFVEAAACGLPVVGLKDKGAWDALAEGRLGMALDADNSEALLQGLISTLRDKKSPAAECARFESIHFKQHSQHLLDAFFPHA